MYRHRHDLCPVLHYRTVRVLLWYDPQAPVLFCSTWWCRRVWHCTTRVPYVAQLYAAASGTCCSSAFWHLVSGDELARHSNADRQMTRHLLAVFEMCNDPSWFRHDAVHGALFEQWQLVGILHQLSGLQMWLMGFVPQRMWHKILKSTM